MKSLHAYFFLCFLVLLCRCMHVSTLKPGPVAAVSDHGIAEAIQRADSVAVRAANKPDCLKAIQMYKDILTIDPYHYHAAVSAAHLSLLMGDAYYHSRRDKARIFREAIHLAEVAMCSNETMRNGLLSGKRPWELTTHLSVGQMEAMAFWINGIYYYYKDCQGPFMQILNFRWIRRAKQMTERMTKLDPLWGGGMVSFLWGIYYLAIPRSVGGNTKTAETYFQKAIDTGPDWPHFRWGRGKYFHVKMRNRKGFEQDLRWILKQDMADLRGHGAWKAFFKKDAERMLSQIDILFE